MARRPLLEQWRIDQFGDTGADAISLVSKAATKQTYKVLFAETPEKEFQEGDEEFQLAFIKYLEEQSAFEVPPNQEVIDKLQGKNLVASPIFIADRPIKRLGIDYDALALIDFTKPEEEVRAEIREKVLYNFYIVISEDDVRTMANKYIKRGNQGKLNIQHDQDNFVEGVNLIQSWTVEDSYHDKSNSFGWVLNTGSWFGLFEIDNEEVRENFIKSGLLQGVSVELETNDRVIFSEEGKDAKVKELLKDIIDGLL